MAIDHKGLFDAVRDIARRGLTTDEVARLNRALGEGPTPTAAVTRLTVAGLQQRLGVTADGQFGDGSRKALFSHLTNRNAPAITAADIQRAADALNISPKMIAAVRRVEAPRGAFDDQGRPSILYERHVFRRSTTPVGRFDLTSPRLSGPPSKPGTYGAFSAQYDFLASACALDPEAAFSACSWGAFQVLGENAKALGYGSALDMALTLVASEAAHLDSFVRFVKANGLDDELRACRPGDAASCVPFVSRYNGPNHAAFGYAPKLANAAL